MKVLFILPHYYEAASNRYRVYQYLPYLRENGIEPVVHPFVDSPSFYRILYGKGNIIPKIVHTLRSLGKRLVDTIDFTKYDLVFIQREALPFGPPVLEKLIAQRKPIIFDFDDAIYLPNTSQANRWLMKLKFPSKTAEIIKRSECVIAGNAYLANFARQYNSRVTILPTPIDTERYSLKPQSKNGASSVTIGWVGGHSTEKYLKMLDKVFLELSKSYPVNFEIVGGYYALPGIQVNNRQWKLENEILDLHRFDIGIMPMPDNEWTRGKCGFKAIQYMGVGIPAVASPVGVNSEIIQNGENGFLAGNDEEWIQSLSKLIENPDLRYEIGLAGRKTVELQYSLKVNAPKFVNIIKKAVL